jgi:hypothetical protein
MDRYAASNNPTLSCHYRQAKASMPILVMIGGSVRGGDLVKILKALSEIVEFPFISSALQALGMSVFRQAAGL